MRRDTLEHEEFFCRNCRVKFSNFYSIPLIPITFSPNLIIGDNKENYETKTSNALNFLGNILNAQLGVLSNSKGLSSDSPFSEGVR